MTLNEVRDLAVGDRVSSDHQGKHSEGIVEYVGEHVLIHWGGPHYTTIDFHLPTDPDFLSSLVKID